MTPRFTLETADLLAYTAIIIMISLLLERLLLIHYSEPQCRYFMVHGMSGRRAGPEYMSIIVAAPVCKP